MSTSDGLSGVQFPADAQGRRSTAAASKSVMAAAVEQQKPTLAAAILAEPNWRKHYGRYLVELVELAVSAGSGVIGMVDDGLEAVHEQFRFYRDGEAMTPREAMQRYREPVYHTGTVAGQGARATQLEVPYRGGLLKGDGLRRQIEIWLKRGVLEPSAAAALLSVCDHADWLDLRDLHFVLLGAAAEIGPAEVLSQFGANIVAVDLDRPAVWHRLFSIARAGAGQLSFPLREAVGDSASDAQAAAVAGCDLLVMAPEIRTWLASLEHSFCIGGYAYLHGQDHVRVEVAMDAIMADLTRQRPDIALAFLLTPTDVFAIPEAAAQAAREDFSGSGGLRWWRPLLRTLSRNRLYAPNAARDLHDGEGHRFGLYDGVVPAQGPNYALAKRLQKWRALSARAQGHRVSANVAPSTATASVLTRRDFKAAFAGAGHYGVEIFEPATTNAVMAALLIHDLRNDQCVANPPVPLTHPLELFMAGAVHGGVWRAGLQLRSVLEIAAVRGLLSVRRD